MHQCTSLGIVHASVATFPVDSSLRCQERLSIVPPPPSILKEGDFLRCLVRQVEVIDQGLGVMDGRLGAFGAGGGTIESLTN